jgi:hypothetical protein
MARIGLLVAGEIILTFVKRYHWYRLKTFKVTHCSATCSGYPINKDNNQEKDLEMACHDIFSVEPR